MVSVEQNSPNGFPPSWPTMSISTKPGTPSFHSDQVRIGICDFNSVPGLVCEAAMGDELAAEIAKATIDGVRGTHGDECRLFSIGDCNFAVSFECRNEHLQHWRQSLSGRIASHSPAQHRQSTSSGRIGWRSRGAQGRTHLLERLPLGEGPAEHGHGASPSARRAHRGSSPFPSSSRVDISPRAWPLLLCAVPPKAPLSRRNRRNWLVCRGCRQKRTFLDESTNRASADLLDESTRE